MPDTAPWKSRLQIYDSCPMHYTISYEVLQNCHQQHVHRLDKPTTSSTNSNTNRNKIKIAIRGRPTEVLEGSQKDKRGLSPVVNDCYGLAHQVVDVCSMQGSREGLPEASPGHFLMWPCCPDPEQAHAGVANDFMSSPYFICLMLLQQGKGLVASVNHSLLPFTSVP